MKYCKKCVQPDTRPNILFDENQICYACKYEDDKKSIDWAQREAELLKIVEETKEKTKNSNGAYDCVIGVSGGKDSTFQAIYAKEKLNLKVLLVNGVPDEITDIGKYNIQNLINKGFDIIQMTPNPTIAKKLAKKSFEETGNILKPSEYALWASAYIIADKFDIPLIIQGENAALTLGTVVGLNADGNAFGVTKTNTLKGCSASDLLMDGVDISDLYFYDFPSVKKLIEKGTRAIWLQYYTKEWSQVHNAEFAVQRGLKGREDDNLEDIGRYRIYTALDSDVQIVNQMLKYLKFGFGFATDEACYDIREGRISRQKGVELIKQYDGKCGQKYIDKFCKYIDIDEQVFWETVDKFVNTKLFEKNKNGKWMPKFEIGEDYE